MCVCTRARAPVYVLHAFVTSLPDLTRRDFPIYTDTRIMYFIRVTADEHNKL